MIPFQLTDCHQRKILTADVCQILNDLRSLAPIGIQINHRLVWRGTFEYIYSFCSTEKEFILPPPHHWRMLRKLRGSESPAPVPSYLYSPLVPPYFCAYIVFEISTKVNFCFINFDASSLPAFSPIFRLFIWDILADSAIMVKSVRLCRTEPAIFKEDIIMSKIVNEAKIGHLRSGLLPLLPDIHYLHRRRFSAWSSRLSCSKGAVG